MLAEEETFAALVRSKRAHPYQCPVRTMKTDGVVMLMLIPLNGVGATGS
jgi:hypothetical protein